MQTAKAAFQVEIERNQGRNAIECSVAPFEGHYTQQAYVQVVRDITDRRRLAAERETLVLALGERIKELRCIQAIAQLIETPGLTLAQLLQGVTERLAAGFALPEQVGVAITGALVLIHISEPTRQDAVSYGVF